MLVANEALSLGGLLGRVLVVKSLHRKTQGGRRYKHALLEEHPGDPTPVRVTASPWSSCWRQESPGGLSGQWVWRPRFSREDAGAVVSPLAAGGPSSAGGSAP